MHIFRRNLGLISALSMLAFAGACTGFFVSPTLSSIAIGPTNQTITAIPKQTLQMSATGTYSDGSTKDLSGKVSWSSSDTTCATINSAGLVSPPSGSVPGGVCTATITAAEGAVSSSTASITVSQGTPTSILLTVNGSQTGVTVMPNTSVTFQAKASFPTVTTQPDITTSCTWNNTDSADLMLTTGNTMGTIAATPTGNQAVVSCTFGGTQSNTVTVGF